MTISVLPTQFGICEDTGWLDDSTFEDFSLVVNSLFGIPLRHYLCGITKIVLPDISDNWVYKFAFNGIYRSIWSCSTEEYEHKWTYFTGGEKGNYFNYCDLEMSILEKAPEKFKCIFPETIVEEVCGVKYYKQEKCADIDYCDEELLKDEMTIEDYMTLPDCARARMRGHWLASVKNFYGIDFLKELLLWLDDNSLLSDMHSGNYGYSEIDNRPVIIDWGGYNSK